jgi:uncharacterized membrane protein
MYIILTLLLVLLFLKVYHQSSQIRELKGFLESLKRQIKFLRRQLAELKTPLDAGLDGTKADLKGIETSGDESRHAGPSMPAPEAEKQKSPPMPVSGYTQPVKPQEQLPEKEKAAVDMQETKKWIPDRGINWENFLGAKMFAWVGGLSLFIGFIFLLKYSFDHNLISPAVRVALGFICGSGLIAGGLHLKHKMYEITAQTLCATGIVILYASSFAANFIYHFPVFSPFFTFVLMALITAGAFILAVGMNAIVIAVLGMVGGFLTPPLLSTWQDQPFALFSYITFLNIGLFMVAFHRKWNFLAALGGTGTVFTMLWWSMEYFKPEKVFTAMAVYLWFNVLFCCASWYAKKIKRSDHWLAGSAVALPFVTFLFTLSLVAIDSIGMRPGVIFSYLIGADLALLAVSFLDEKYRKFNMAAGGCVFFILSVWIAVRMTPDLLLWALGGSLVFAILHSAVPIVVARATRSSMRSWHVHLFPLLALFVAMIPILMDTGSWLIWPFVLIFNVGVLALALLTTSALAILAAVIVTGFVVFFWIINEPAGVLGTGDIVILVGAFGVFFSVVGTYVLNRSRQKMSEAGIKNPEGASGSAGESLSDSLFFQIPALSSVLPFLLLILASIKIDIANPASIFGLGLLLTAISVGLARFLKAPVLLPVAMGCLFLLEVIVHIDHFNPENATMFLGFYILATAFFLILPFHYKKDYLETILPWATAASSGPLHFLLVYDAVNQVYPNNFMGLLPAVFAVPFFFGLTNLVAWIPKGSKNRNAIFAWFGGTTLFFITLIFPIQFDHQWLTVSWALEGVALTWLYRKVPHNGLRNVGIALLLVTFVRLALNPAVLLDYDQSVIPIFNWYLYTYGIAIICLMTGGRLLASPRNMVFGIHVQAVHYSLGTILAFLLMNIEIADLFSPGVAIKFQFTGDLARGMTYSIAWALFALCLLIVGIGKKLRPVRLAAIGLLGVTLFKLFLFDLSRLDQLYRIGAFVGVAVVLIAASALYQKWVVRRE